jgi:glutaredoxin
MIKSIVVIFLSIPLISLATPPTPQIPLRLCAPEQISTDIQEFIAARAIAQRPPIALYTTNHCVYCRQAKAYLDNRGLIYHEYHIDTEAHSRAAFQALGGLGVPLITVGNARLNGFKPELLEHVLQRNGYFNPNPHP